MVLPSKRETWGIVVNEAMCFSFPVLVSSQVGAARDLVHDGENGFIFPSGEVSPRMSICSAIHPSCLAIQEAMRNAKHFFPKSAFPP